MKKKERITGIQLGIFEDKPFHLNERGEIIYDKCDAPFIPYFIMMVGVPGSGKSTKAKELAIEYDAQIFSSDQYRKDMFGDENNQEHNEEVFNALKRDVVKCLKEGRSAILDACNVHSKRRTQSLELIKDVDCFRMAYIMTTSYLSCVSRDKGRDKFVGSSIIEKFISAYEIPYYKEGWDYIRFDGLDVGEMREYEPEADEVQKELMLGFDQKNPHHTKDLLGHSLALQEQYPKNTLEYIAAIYHDYGKMYTQSFGEDGVAHYYTHANWSTFLMLSHFNCIPAKNQRELLDVLFIINNHMKIRDIIRNNKTVLKYKKLWGIEMFSRMVEFMRCDNIASGTSDERDQLAARQ